MATLLNLEFIEGTPYAECSRCEQQAELTHMPVYDDGLHGEMFCLPCAKAIHEQHKD